MFHQFAFPPTISTEGGLAMCLHSGTAGYRCSLVFVGAKLIKMPVLFDPPYTSEDFVPQMDSHICAMMLTEGYRRQCRLY